MNASVNVVIDVAPGVFTALNLLAGIVSGLHGKTALAVNTPLVSGTNTIIPHTATPDTFVPVDSTSIPLPPAVGTPTPDETMPSTVNPSKPTATITPADMRAVAATKDKAKVKALLDKYECASLSGVPEAERAVFLAELEAL